MAFEEALNVLGEDVNLEVDGIAGGKLSEGRGLERVWDQGSRDGLAIHRGDGQGHAVEADRSLLNAVAGKVRRHPEAQVRTVPVRLEAEDLADAVDMALDEVTAESGGRQKGSLEVYLCSGSQAPEPGPGQGLTDHVEIGFGAADPGHGHAAARKGHRIPNRQALDDGSEVDGDVHSVPIWTDRENTALALDQPSEHSIRVPPSPAASLDWLGCPI